jgi:hypothetical protein
MGPSASEDGKKKLLSRRQSIFDAVRGDLADLQKKVGAQEFRKVQEHVDAISDMEKSLFQPSVGGATCSAPKAPPELRVSDMAAFPALGKAQMDLLVLALQCNLTRVASIQWSHTVSPLLMSWLGLSEAHHELSHKDDSNVQGVANFVKAERWFAEQFGYFLEKMKATPDPAGGTLFDSSLILWVKELGDSRLHNGKSVPFILAGGASGRLKTGRYLNFNGASHKKLLASACQIMGVDTSGLGADGVAFTELTS